MSPLTSRPSTPVTPSTGLTIPSPGPSSKPESISLPPSPSQSDASLLDQLDTPPNVTQPADIALPPSPKTVKSALPFRRPRISNPLNRVASPSTARTASGRRVSSVLQYAMHHDIDTGIEAGASNQRAVSGTDDSADIDLAYYQEMVNEASSDSDDLEEIPGNNWDSTLGFGGQVPDLVGEAGIVGDEDEAWMGYVRAQLNTLFPDYFDATAQDDAEGDISISTIASSDLTTPPIGTRLGPGLRIGRGVPNIRSEIGGLTEDIERLRGVVSGLAEGMKAAQGSPEVGTSIVEAAEVPTLGPVGGSTEAGLPEDFLKTAHLSIDIIRLIHTSLGGVPCPDSELFSVENLTIIKHHFQILQENDLL